MTLDHLARMVRDGQDFVVNDAKTGDDITRGVLAQIIFEEEAKGQTMLPSAFLRQLIRLYGDSLQGFVPGYLEASMETFARNQEAMREQVRQAFEANPALANFEALARSTYVFLANLDPVIQLDVLRSMERPRLAALDTMNFWIKGKPTELRRVLGEVDALLVNDTEARMLAGEPSLVKAARTILGWGPRVVVVKRGEYGALMVTPERFFFVPAYPLESVFDPTGAGDTFAGGFMGVLAGAGEADEAALRRAIVYGSVIASFTVEDFSLNRLKRLTRADIEARYRAFREMMQGISLARCDFESTTGVLESRRVAEVQRREQCGPIQRECTRRDHRGCDQPLPRHPAIGEPGSHALSWPDA